MRKNKKRKNCQFSFARIGRERGDIRRIKVNFLEFISPEKRDIIQKNKSDL